MHMPTHQTSKSFACTDIAWINIMTDFITLTWWTWMVCFKQERGTIGALVDILKWMSERPMAMVKMEYDVPCKCTSLPGILLCIQHWCALSTDVEDKANKRLHGDCQTWKSELRTLFLYLDDGSLHMTDQWTQFLLERAWEILWCNNFAHQDSNRDDRDHGP